MNHQFELTEGIMASLRGHRFRWGSFGDFDGNGDGLEARHLFVETFHASSAMCDAEGGDDSPWRYESHVANTDMAAQLCIAA